MSRKTPALNEMDLNSPQIRDLESMTFSKPSMCKKSLNREGDFAETKENSNASLPITPVSDHKIWLSAIDDFLKQKPTSSIITSSHDLHVYFSQLFKVYTRKHQIQRIKSLSKRYILVIIRLLDTNETTSVMHGIASLYNNTNQHKIATFHDVLLQDFNLNNREYLLTLKILTMQCILKAKVQQKVAPKLIQAFAKDRRYLLRSPSPKITALVKLLLNFMHVLPEFKVAFALKFYQYVKEYRLKFDDYVKNMDENRYQDCIVAWAASASRDARELYWPFYAEYSRVNMNICKIMITDLLQADDLNHPRRFFDQMERFMVEGSLTQMQHERLEINYLTWQEDEELRQRVSLCLKTTKKTNLADAFTLFSLYMRYISNYGLRFGGHVKNFDGILNLLNRHLREININLLEEMFKYFKNFCIEILDGKRLQNVANIAYNAFVIHGSSDFLITAVNLETTRYTQIAQNENSFQILRKFIMSAPAHLRPALFDGVFNVFLVFEYSLRSLIELTKTEFVPIFKKCRFEKLPGSWTSSELMDCLLLSMTKLTWAGTGSWSLLPRRYYEISVDQNIEFKNTPDFKTDSLDPLRRMAPIIELHWHLTKEIKDHQTRLLSKIANVYINDWVQSPAIDKNDRATEIELNLAEVLLNYLTFNKHHKQVLRICDALKQSYSFCDRFSNLVERNGENSRIELRLSLKWPDDVGLLSSAGIQETLASTGSNSEACYAILNFSLKRSVFSGKYQLFNEFFVNWLPKNRPDLFDIRNTSKQTNSKYLKVLMLNIKMIQSASKLYEMGLRFDDALVEAKKALKICQTLLSKSDKIPLDIKWELIDALNALFSSVMKIYTHVGSARDCEFYMAECLSVMGHLKEPSALFDVMALAAGYYKLTSQADLANEFTNRLNETFNRIEGSENIDALTKYFFANKEYDKLLNSLELFFGEKLGKTALWNYWRLRTGCTVDVPRDPWETASNCMNAIRQIHDSLSRQMNDDPYLNSFNDTVLTIPSVLLPTLHKANDRRPITIEGTPLKKTPHFKNFSSPRPSSLTPRNASLKQRFDQANIISQSVKGRSVIRDINSNFLNNFDMKKVAHFEVEFALIESMMKSACSPKAAFRSFFILSELARYMPYYNERLLASRSKDALVNFCLREVDAPQCPVTSQRASIGKLSELVDKLSAQRYSIISIDSCELTNDLILSKTDSRGEVHDILRLPLNRHRSRDMDSSEFTFNDALSQMREIIKESSLTTSIEVTSNIKSKEQRKKWWQLRYELDSKLHSLLDKIENTWFGAFKAFFRDDFLSQEAKLMARVKLQDILQQNLPSRKLYGDPTMFYQLDDCVLNMLSKLDPAEEQFTDMLDDLIYYIIDVLLLHGEQNACDEIDLSLVHVQLKELIKECRAHKDFLVETSHIFLLIGTEAHLIPWESLSFLRERAVSRIPSVTFLANLLKKNGGLISPKIQLTERLSMILNPQGDLVRTEETFAQTFSDWAASVPNSRLIIGQKPSDESFLEMLRDSSIFIYVGHGGGEQFVKSKELKVCNELSPTFLLGCSSAYLRTFGQLEPHGILKAYLSAGCPMIVGNLWDVTDRDIDKFSYAMFDQMGLLQSDKKPENFAVSVSRAREACHLQYLNGAAPVIYGLPLKLAR
ncbi:LAMI_0H05556g1_1 [Lachancea mirantina]|uniref:separase n=1 Tax=Lachancea mirantina TaxID=1230905 RepID=A0A1G4KFB0_9SACH|nr:LAMI_0H05556g1_1 [Lachancea mirantina]